MKKFRIIAFLSLLITFNSCNNEAELKTGMTEGDIQKRHQAHPVPAITDACNLTISIDPCFEDVPAYMQAFTNAMLMYNNITNVGINMTIVDNNGDIHFDCYYLQCFNGEGMEGGNAGEFYDGDDETNTIYLNANMPEIAECCGEDFGLCEMTGLIAHEIGHALGFIHTNSPDGIHIEGTPQSDPNSIFNGENFCDTKCRFSRWDVKALRILHPACNCGAPPSFNILYDGPTCLNEIEDFSIQAVPSIQDLEVVEWSVSTNLQIIASGSQVLTIKALSAGPARVCATVVNDCGIEATECFFFYVLPEVNCAVVNDDGGGLGGLNPK